MGTFLIESIIEQKEEEYFVEDKSKENEEEKYHDTSSINIEIKNTEEDQESECNNDLS